MSFPLWICDAFVGQIEQQVLRGNPAAVMLLDEFRDDNWLQLVAAEFNLSETAFLVQRKNNEWDLRWFTPALEVNLCGHATLASAHVLWQSGRADADELKFYTRGGTLSARKQGANDGTDIANDGTDIALDFPSQPVKMAPPSPGLDALIEAVGLRAHADPVAAYRAADDWLLKIARGRLETLQPNFAPLRALAAAQGWRGVIVTARAPRGAPYDFASRFFGAGAGIDEDPATGSAHTKLAPFWSNLLQKDELRAVQLSPRGGWLQLKMRKNRVEIAGRAQIRVRGDWL